MMLTWHCHVAINVQQLCQIEWAIMAAKYASTCVHIGSGGTSSDHVSAFTCVDASSLECLWYIFGSLIAACLALWINWSSVL